MRLVIPRIDLQIGVTTLAGVAIGFHRTLAATAETPRAQLPSEYLWTIATCAVPDFACAWISRPRPQPAYSAPAPSTATPVPATQASPDGPEGRLEA